MILTSKNLAYKANIRLRYSVSHPLFKVRILEFIICSAFTFKTNVLVK